VTKLADIPANIEIFDKIIKIKNIFLGRYLRELIICDTAGCRNSDCDLHHPW